ncbi:hypothetical protein NSP08_23825, partial [Salmonella enterica]|nr:hypothetical protein [Salmonella enterica]
SARARIVLAVSSGFPVLSLSLVFFFKAYGLQGAARYPKIMGGRARKLSIIADRTAGRKPAALRKSGTRYPAPPDAAHRPHRSPA